MASGHLDISGKSLTSNSEKFKNVIIGILIIVLVGLIIKVCLPSGESNTDKSDIENNVSRPIPPGEFGNICLSEACIGAADRVLKNINTKVLILIVLIVRKDINNILLFLG